MTERGIIIGTFVKKNRILSFIETLRNEFGIKLDKLFIYTIDTNKREYLVTFKTFDKDKFIKNLGNATVMHVKNGCLFSINALNKLIEKDNEGSNLPNNEFIVDWNKYKDKLIIITNRPVELNRSVFLFAIVVFYKNNLTIRHT